jgi:hypothetical protein
VADDTARKLLSGPAATIREAISLDPWHQRLLQLSTPHEAKCHLCGEEHGPDTLRSIERWVEEHLRAEHGVPVGGAYAVRSGQERW